MNQRLSKALIVLLFANISAIFVSVAFTFNLGESSTTSSQTTSLKTLSQDNFNLLQSNEAIVWFGVGVFGYAAIYAIAKNIVEK